jgi:7-carboxy-7-deazaguanine synthase
MKSSLRVVEIFNSIQGEGANVGMSATFIRLSDCNLNCTFCDTDWSVGTVMSIQDVWCEVEKYATKMLVWTGGEPTLQLTSDILNSFPGYYHAIETNGTNPVPPEINYISCSSKVTVSLLKKNFVSVDEFRFPVVSGDILPSIDELPSASNYFLSPLFDGEDRKKNVINMENVNYCLSLVEKEPRWRISVQLHKILHVR